MELAEPDSGTAKGSELRLNLPQHFSKPGVEDGQAVDSAWEAFDALRLDTAASRGAAQIDTEDAVSDASDLGAFVDVAPFDAFPDDAEREACDVGFNEANSVFEYDDRIKDDLRPFVCVGRHGGLVFTPRVALEVDPADPRLAEACRLVAENGLLCGRRGLLDAKQVCEEHNEGESTTTLEDVNMLTASANQEEDPDSAPEIAIPGISDDACNYSDLDPGTAPTLAGLDSNLTEDACRNPETSQNDEHVELPQMPKHFSWMDSACRQTAVEFGKFVHAYQTEQQLAEQKAVEAALATAQAASERSGKEDFPVDTKEHPSGSTVEDVNAWVTRERIFISDTLRAVTQNVQKRARRSSGLASFSGSGVEADDSWTWGFLLPKSTKLKPEAAAEMARARVAAAAAAKAMQEDDQEKFQGSDRNGPSRSLDATAEGSARHRRRPISEPPLHRSPLSMRKGGDPADGRYTEGSSLALLDELTMLHRSQLQNAIPITSLDALIGNPGFPRALSEDSTRQASKKAPVKKRVSFGVSTVCDD